MGTVAGAVLAAGAGRRMGRPKADLIVGGERLLDRAVRALRDGGCTPIVAVVRSGTSVSGARALVNPDPDRGMRSSLALAVEAVPGAAALAVVLVDAPGVGGAAIGAVVSTWRAGRIAVADFAGRRGHPIVMALDFWREAISLAGEDEGARAFLSLHGDLVDEVSVEGDPADVDTPEQLSRWL